MDAVSATRPEIVYDLGGDHYLLVVEGEFGWNIGEVVWNGSRTLERDLPQAEAKTLAAAYVATRSY
ncbi:hypothetical protein, partial [Salmonella enterica]|uniref:hypothetical protein n=1 Tax=Salmonella enterica TaxID=28901 RepID=UPI003297F31F